MKRITGKAIASFAVSFLLCTALISISVFNRIRVEMLTMEQLILEKSAKANEVLSRLLYKAQTLSALVVKGHRGVENFEQTAAIIIDDPAILNVLIAPGGIVTNVYPLNGNEAVIGLDFFSEGAGNREAVRAKETGRLVLGGPFESVQGGQVLVGRLPVFLHTPAGTERFWGLVSVTLKYPQALDGAGLNELQAQGFAYEVWRVNPDSGEKQIISSSGYNYNKKVRYIEKHVSVQNTDWYFRILPVRAWYEYPETWVLVFLGFCMSALVAFVVQNNSELKALKSNYEKLSHTDALTGIHNRRYFVEAASTQIERVARTAGNAFMVIFDIDNFKQINDMYGHPAGDDVLKHIVSKVKGIIRPYDLFARHGGDEFTILITDIDEPDVRNLVERIRLAIFEEPFVCGETRLPVTASFGIAPVTPAGSVMTAIDLADKALYAAKDAGRNKVVFFACAPSAGSFVAA